MALRGAGPRGLWTKVAEPYPHALCDFLGAAICHEVGWAALQVKPSVSRFIHPREHSSKFDPRYWDRNHPIAHVCISLSFCLVWALTLVCVWSPRAPRVRVGDIDAVEIVGPQSASMRDKSYRLFLEWLGDCGVSADLRTC